MKATNIEQMKLRNRAARRTRVRKRIYGTAERPRLSVFRSNRYIYAQVIDDTSGKTVAASSTLSDTNGGGKSAKSVDDAAALGTRIAELAREQGVSRVVFDKGWYSYHGRIKALADAAREAGLEF